MKKNKKLYYFSGLDFTLPYHVNGNGVVTRKSASGIPILLWPNGRWCISANMYVLSLYNRRLSRRDRGGTLLTYAANISHLLRFAFANRTDLHELTDNQFTLFINGLSAEWRASNPTVKTRDSNSVIAIGCNCLDFLESVGKRYGLANFIGPEGQILAEKRICDGDKSKDGKNSIQHSNWYHRSFPTPDPLKERLPISTKLIEQLQDAVSKCSRSSYLRKRRYTMLKLLEITGGRRSEIAALTVESVIEASKMQMPLLKLLTVKGRKGRDSYRYVPISRHDVEYLLEFIEKNRRSIIRKTCGHANDDGYLLVSETTGKKLRPNTLTQEVSMLKKQAGIEQQACPHMFRHRFLTKLLVALIEQHNFENEDDFRKALLDSNILKQKLLEYSGHRRLSSIDRYIHLAFEEVASYKKTYDAVRARCAIDSFKASLAQVAHELEDGAAPTESIRQLLKLTDALTKDLVTHPLQNLKAEGNS